MNNSFYSDISNQEIGYRIQNIVNINFKTLDKRTLDIGAILYRRFKEDIEFPLKNEHLEKILNCNITKGRQQIDKLREAGVLKKTLKSCLERKACQYFHYTLAKLPALTSEQIDKLICNENKLFESFKSNERKSAFVCFIQNKKNDIKNMKKESIVL